LGDSIRDANKIWTVEYSTTANSESNLDEDASENELTRTLQGGGDNLNVGTIKGITWTNAATAKTDIDTVSVVIATTNITKIYRNYNTLLTRLQTYAGKANSSSFLGQPTGTVMLLGGTANEFINKLKKKRWKVVFSFALRCITSNLATGTYGGWNHAFNKDTGKWDTLTKGEVQYTLIDLAAINTVLRSG
jgi:hypothetical protein